MNTKPDPAGYSPRARDGYGHHCRRVHTMASLPLMVHLPFRHSDQELYELCLANDDLRIERTVEGDLLIMPPAGFRSSHRNARVVAQLQQWAERDGSGLVTDSSGGYLLPDTSMFAPDAAWVQHERLDELTGEEQERFLPLCPDFVIELLSQSDSLADTQAKMRQYLANGLRLGWLIDPFDRRVYVYRAGQDVEILYEPDNVQGDPVLAGFRLELASIW